MRLSFAHPSLENQESPQHQSGRAVNMVGEPRLLRVVPLEAPCLRGPQDSLSRYGCVSESPGDLPLADMEPSEQHPALTSVSSF